jgi:Domain of unknown function (DUF5666)
MTVEFDESSRDEHPDDELLPGPGSHRRRWITIACAAVVAAMLAGGAVAVADSSTTTTGKTAAGSSSAPTANSSGAPSAPSGHPGRPENRGNGAPLLPKSMKPLLAGTVKSVSGDTIVITDFQGFSRTIVTSSKTVYKNGLTSAPKVGSRIAAQGTVDANGTSLDATLITSWPANGGARGGHPPFGHFGGPGPRPTSFPSGVRPSGFPTGRYPAPKPPAPPTSGSTS